MEECNSIYYPPFFDYAIVSAIPQCVFRDRVIFNFDHLKHVHYFSRGETRILANAVKIALKLYDALQLYMPICADFATLPEDNEDVVMAHKEMTRIARELEVVQAHLRDAIRERLYPIYESKEEAGDVCETRVYNVIGDTRRKIDDACEVLVQTSGNLRQPGMDSIASYLHKGPDKTAWLILVGPFNAMCDFASETARELAAHINEEVKNIMEKRNDGQAD